MGWNGMGWDGMEWDGMGWNGMANGQAIIEVCDTAPVFKEWTVALTRSPPAERAHEQYGARN